ncbi:hypothetical protein HAX54_033151, partial [Datura stramonium]|nr:hypothetical protein [Datura stramonium]
MFVRSVRAGGENKVEHVSVLSSVRKAGQTARTKRRVARTSHRREGGASRRIRLEASLCLGLHL